VSDIGLKRAESLYERVLNEYGDDSVAQLGGAHVACEGASNVLTKVLERGRLMAYLEQSTRYVPYNGRQGGRWLYLIPEELAGSPIQERYIDTLDNAFSVYSRWLGPIQDYHSACHPNLSGDSDAVYKRAMKAKSLDTLRGLLPAATRSNVGLYGSGQAYESLLLRMRSNPLREVQSCGDMLLAELRKVIPAFLKRIDQPDRGVIWSDYLSRTRIETSNVVEAAVAGEEPESCPEVTLSDFDPEGEIKVVAAVIYESSDLPDSRTLEIARRMSADRRSALLRSYVGDRKNRRHKPGRAFERTSYRFDVLTDYGAFRDLQRHRLLTVEWQSLSTRHGYTIPDAIEPAGALSDWRRVMEESAALYDVLAAGQHALVAPYAVAMAYNIRFCMHMNAREAMHLIELRTAPQGHPAYRRVCQAMHRLIAEKAGHRAIAEAMSFVDHSEAETGRLESERASERRLRGQRS
jgi:thymidylate synthase ThyX